MANGDGAKFDLNLTFFWCVKMNGFNLQRFSKCMANGSFNLWRNATPYLGRALSSSAPLSSPNSSLFSARVVFGCHGPFAQRCKGQAPARVQRPQKARQDNRMLRFLG